jgi:hypothetical protein
MEDVGVFYAHFVDFTAICHVLLPFGMFYGYLVHTFSRFGILYQEKYGNPGDLIGKQELLPILRLLNLQLQHQRCKFLQSWRCNSWS